MALFVVAVGVLVLAIAAALLVAPRKLKPVFFAVAEKDRFYLAAGIRIIVGLLFLFAAQSTRAPTLMLYLGIFVILAGAMIPIVGHARILAFAKWWVEKPDYLMRVWALLAAAFGILLVWAGS